MLTAMPIASMWPPSRAARASENPWKFTERNFTPALLPTASPTRLSRLAMPSEPKKGRSDCFEIVDNRGERFVGAVLSNGNDVGLVDYVAEELECLQRIEGQSAGRGNASDSRIVDAAQRLAVRLGGSDVSPGNRPTGAWSILKTIGTFRTFSRAGANVRRLTSIELPAGNPTITLIGRFG